MAKSKLHRVNYRQKKTVACNDYSLGYTIPVPTMCCHNHPAGIDTRWGILIKRPVEWGPALMSKQEWQRAPRHTARARHSTSGQSRTERTRPRNWASGDAATQHGQCRFHEWALAPADQHTVESARYQLTVKSQYVSACTAGDFPQSIVDVNHCVSFEYKPSTMNVRRRWTEGDLQILL